MNNEVQKCKDYIKKLNGNYKNKHLLESEFDELISENNVEKRDVKGYHGREIFELLQNADDAFQNSINDGIIPEKELIVNIKYINNILTISNTGTLFSEAGIKSIVQGNNSSKSKGYIGNKGTGFRSILNWSNKIRIFSGYYKIEFSQENANIFFEEIKEKKQIKKQLQKRKDLYIPILSAPKFIEDFEKDYYNETIIQIFIESDKILDDYNVEKQINDIDLKILLFLPNVSIINIETESDIISYQRKKIELDLNHNQNTENCDDQISRVSLKKIINGMEMDEEYEVFERNIKNFHEVDDLKKDIHLTVAVPYNNQTFNNHLYSYFPLLDTASPFNCVMHATYDLSDQRNTLNKNEINKRIILEQFKHLVSISNYYIDANDNIKALKVLTPANINDYDHYYAWKFNVGFSVFNVENDYLSLLKDVKFFRNVNGICLSLNDHPKLIDDKAPEFIKGKQFDHLIKPFKDEKLNAFIKFLSQKYSVNLTINEEDLKAKIDHLTECLTAEKRVECFDWWSTQYRNSLPHLLKKQDGSWIEFGEECYFLDGAFGDMQLPKWVKIPAISMEYQNLLYAKARQNEKVIKLIENGDTNAISRIISQNKIYPQVKFTYRDKSTIIPTINSSVDNYDKSLEFVKWLYDNYKSEPDWSPPSRSDNPIRYLFPTNDKTIYYADQLFFSSTYGYDLSEKIFDETFKEFVSYDILNLNGIEIQNFISFVSKFGVRSYPKIEKMEIKILEKTFVEELKKDIFSSHQQWMGTSKNVSNMLGKFPFISNIEQILSKLTTYEVVEWLYKDNNLVSALQNKYYLNDREYEIEYKGDRQSQYHPYKGKIRNYLLTIFNTSKWIDINNERYSPKEVILDLYNKNAKKFGNLVPILTKELLLNISMTIEIPYDFLIDLLKMFDFCEKVTDLSSQDFYKLLLLIPEQNRNQSIEMSTSIYSIIERTDFNGTYEDSDNKRRFLKIGKVLTKKQEYRTASEVYLPSIKIINRSQYPILDKGPRTNNEKFVEIFGCKEFKEEFQIIEKSIIIHPTNQKFQEYFLEFRKYASAYGLKNDRIEKVISNLTITLVSRIEVKIETNISLIADDYCEVRERDKKWYIFIKDNTFEIIKLSESIENIFTNIAYTPGFDAGKIGELFRTGNKNTREFLIEKEFGTLSVIDGKSFSEEVEDNFKQTVLKLDPYYDIKKLDINFNDFYSYESLEKIVHLFNQLNIKSINSFIKNGFCYDLEFTLYYRKKLDVFINNEKRNYKNYIFNLAIKDVNKQHAFLKLCDEFENYAIENRIVEVVDIEEIMKKHFGDWTLHSEYLDSEEEYQKNYTSLNPNDKFQDEISNNYSVREMIYFHLKDEFKEWYSKQEENFKHEKNTENPYEKYFNIIPKEECISYSSQDEKLTSEKKLLQKTTPFSEDAKNKKNKNKKILGNKGELLIYNFLKDKYGSKNVFPKSEAFVSLKILKPGQAVSGNYDIEYVDPNTKIRYFVEVKSGDKNSFFITPNELRFAKEHKKEYILYVVYDFESSPPRFFKIEEEFWNDSHYNQEEIIERIHVTF